MNGKFGRVLLIVGPCVACLGLAASPPVFTQQAKPQAKTPDIQGTWDLVSWERNGKDQKPQKVRIFLTESLIYCEGVSLPDDKDFYRWHYELSPGDQPNTAILNLSTLQGRVMVPGLCGLDGATLRIVLGRVTPTGGLSLNKVKADRPNAFATKPGSDQLLLVLKRAAAADDPITLLRKLGVAMETLTLGHVYLRGEQGKQARNEDLAVIKKYPLIFSLSLEGCQVTDDGLVHLKDMPNLTYLTFADVPITNEGLVHLEGLKITDLHVHSTKVTGAGLRRLTGLQSLGLQGAAFTDADLAHLRGLTKLKRLNLSKTAITDAGLVHLKALTNLTELVLESTKVTDAGLEHLRGLTKLRSLRIKGTNVTDKGARALRTAIPKLEEIER
jgi:Leucine-rich repeat (LRR) protein